MNPTYNLNLPHSHTGETVSFPLDSSLPGKFSFCAICKRNLSQERVTVRIEGKIYCTGCELLHEEESASLDALFDELKEADYAPAPWWY